MTPGSALEDDLGADSVDLVDLAVTLEQEFNLPGDGRERARHDQNRVRCGGLHRKAAGGLNERKTRAGRER